ncbi:MAG: hypothetical protein NWQ16_13205 [Akkermansiaceae bacterium]|nr:hypothetical protein [Akkermansiaceae bacterium]
MKATPVLLILLAFSCPLKAQNFEPEQEEKAISDEVQKAIDEFNRMKREGRETENEVSVVLDPPAPIPTPIAEEEDEESVPDDKEAVLITGTPPLETEFDVPEEIIEEIVTLEEDPEPEPVPAEEPAPAPENKEPGLEIKVESVTKGTGQIDPSKVKLKASFAPKPLSTPPAGWSLEKSEDAPALVKSVELQPGTSITLRIQPHVLSPESDGLNVFSVGEPGFETALGYRQTQTVSAILGDSVAKLDSDSIRLGNAISDLHNLLASLPKPEPLPDEIAE